MRISDWSSDVCSSDLSALAAATWFTASSSGRRRIGVPGGKAESSREGKLGDSITNWPKSSARRIRRSEEQTSELQSLMRISYAVFCLKKKNQNTCMKHSAHSSRSERTEHIQQK